VRGGLAALLVAIWGTASVAGDRPVAGSLYRGCAMPALHGRFFYTDYCDSLIRSFAGVSSGDAQDLRDHPELAPGIANIVSFGEDARGELLMADFGDIAGSPGLGRVWRIVPGS
jgi:hypothetical protein